MHCSLRNRLAVERIGAVHECAIVLAVDAGLREQVEAERRRFGSEQVVERQLDPHITLLYGGFQPPATLRRLDALARAFAGEEIEVVLDGVDVFANRNGFITNIHYRIRSDALYALHRAALRGFAELSLPLQTSYVDAHYVPHLSIFDRVLLPKDLTTLMTLPERRHWRAGGCQLIGEAR